MKMMCRAKIWVGAMMVGLQVQATDYTWDGGAITDNWPDINNWNPNGTVAPVGVTAAHRLNVTGTQILNYKTAQGTTVYANTAGRGLVIGSGTNFRGYLSITGGSFSTLGAKDGDVVGNGSGAIATLIIDGGTFTSTTAGINLGIGGGPTSTMIVSNGTATVSTLNMNATTANLSLAGGVLEANAITRTAGNTANMTFDGGTLRARVDSTTFLQGLNSLKVESAGAVIDTNGKSVTILQNLLTGTTTGGGLQKSGTGTLTLTGSSTYTGKTLVTGGTLQMGNGTTDGAIASASVISNDAALVYNIVGTRTAANQIDGAGTLTKSSAGTVTLSGNNTFTGAATISGGRLILASTSALGTVNGNVTLGNGTTLELATDATVAAEVMNLGSGSSASVVVNRATSGAAITHQLGVATFGNGTLSVSAGANVSSGTPVLEFSGIILSAGVPGLSTGLMLQPTTADVLVSGTITRVGGSANLLTLAGTSTGSQIAGAISGSQAVTKTGAGTWTLAAANTYTGITTIEEGTLKLGASASLATASSVAITAGATFDVSAISSYTWGSSAGLTASGSASAAATIAGGTSVALNGRPVVLTFEPTGFLGDSTHPSLTMSAGSLDLSGSTVTVTNNAASPLGAGDYTVVGGGTVTGTAPTLDATSGVGNGIGLAVNTSASLVLVSGNLILRVVSALPAATTSLALNAGFSTPSAYGAALQFDVTVTGSTPTGDVVLKTGGSAGTTIGLGTLSSGSVTITISPLNILSAMSHDDIVAVYLGDENNAGSVSSPLTQVVQAKALTIADAVAQGKLYDATTATVISGTLSGVVSGDTVTLSGTGEFANVGPGTGIAVTSTSTLGGVSASNYTLNQPTGLTADILASAVWTAAAGGLWNTTGNWLSHVIGAGSGKTADFSTLDITSDTTVNLDSARIIGSLVFGDSDTVSAAGWTLANNSVAGNTLTLAGATPTVTVNALGTDKATTISAVVAGSDGLTKNGSGTLALSGANTYSGATVIGSGMVVAKNNAAFGSTTDGTTVESGSTIDLGNGLAANALNLGVELVTIKGTGVGANGALVNNGANTQINAIRNMALGSDASIGGISRWDMRNAGAALNLNGHTLAKVGTNSVALVGTAVTPGAGAIDVSQGTFSIQTTTTMGGDSANTLTVRNLAMLDLYQGGVSWIAPTWSLVLDDGANFQSSDGSTAWAGPVSLNDAANIGASVALTISGAIAGASGSLTKTGVGTLTLSADNTYAGLTTVSGGALRVSHANALGSSEEGVTVSNAARVEVAGVSVVAEPITINGGGNYYGALQGVSGTSEWSGPVTIGSAGTRIGTAGGTFTVSGVIDSGAIAHGLMFRPNAGSLILSGANTYLGDTTLICGGTSFVQLSGGANRLPTSTKLLFGGSGASGLLDLNGQDQAIAGLSVISGTANEIRSDAAPAALTITAASGSPSTFSGLIAQQISLVKKGSDSLTLSGANTYSEGTTITEGTVVVNHATAVGSGSISMNGGVLKFSAANTTDYSDRLVLEDDKTATFDTAGLAVSFANALATGSAATAGLAKSGTGTLTLSAANMYKGLTTVAGGALRIQHAEALGTTDAGVTVANGARLELEGLTVVGEAITLNGGDGINYWGPLQSASGTSEWQGPVTIGAELTRIGVNTGTFTVSGVIDSGENITGATFRPNTGTLVLSASNTYLGDTTVICNSGGLVQLAGGANRLPVTTKLILGTSNVSGLLDLNGQNQEVVGLSTNQATGANNNEIRSVAAQAILTVNTTNGAPSTFAGKITQNVVLVKKGVESLTLSGANTYSGGTIVSNGTLRVNSAAALPAAGAVTLAVDGSLDLAGASPIATPVTVGSLTSSGGLLKLSTLDRLQVTGNMAGTLRLSLSDPELLAEGGSYVVTKFTGTPPESVTLEGAAHPWTAKVVIGEVRIVKVQGTRVSFF